jgi:hypothetical protein
MMKHFVAYTVLFIAACHHPNSSQTVVDKPEQLDEVSLIINSVERSVNSGGYRISDVHEISISQYRLIERNDFTQSRINSLNILSIVQLNIKDTTVPSAPRTFDALCFSSDKDKDFFLDGVLKDNRDYFKAPSYVLTMNKVILIFSGGSERDRLIIDAEVNQLARRCKLKSVIL